MNIDEAIGGDGKMADIARLTKRASEIFRKGEATTRPAAARKAINGAGIFNTDDVRRLQSQICSALGKMGGEKRNRRRNTAGTYYTARSAR